MPAWREESDKEHAMVAPQVERAEDLWSTLVGFAKIPSSSWFTHTIEACKKNKSLKKARDERPSHQTNETNHDDGAVCACVLDGRCMC